MDHGWDHGSTIIIYFLLAPNPAWFLGYTLQWLPLQWLLAKIQALTQDASWISPFLCVLSLLVLCLAGMAFSVPHDFWIVFCPVKCVRRAFSSWIHSLAHPQAAAARNAARGSGRIPKPEASLSKLALSLASWVQETGHQNQRPQVCVSTENSLYLSIQSVWLLLAKRDRGRRKIADSCWF